MDNPEEVLQALDEFQKMRPSEIPRELEDYLSFVAKTGDPVYQWSLIKPLFREKLVRVMTDFYENCPTLDLASSPNIEHFNYDIMKCNLLELLESFANAPFTVQRICELLTSPRKEYNRVDKYMRAIEKNILVVSTKEPGAAARRSENGDSMINGTIDDDESMPIQQQQPTNEVEMESWVKDCTTTDTNVSPIPTSPHDTPLIVTTNSTNTVATIPPIKITKDLLSDDNTTSIINDKNVQSTLTKSSDMTVSSFIAAAHEMSNTTNITSTLPSNNINITNNDDTLSSSSSSTSLISNNNNNKNSSDNIVTDNNDTPTTIGIVVSDVTDAIINEDTSSQPSLDSESDDSDAHSNTVAIIGNKKLQTTFQTKDFVKMDDGDGNDDNDDKVSNKYYSENDDKIIESKLPLSSLIVNNETDINVDGDGRLSPVQQRDETISNSDDESKSSCDSNPESIEKRPRIECENEITAATVTTTTTTVPTITDRIDNSKTHLTTVISTKNQLNTTDNKSVCNDIIDDKLTIDNEQLIDKDEMKVVGDLIEKPTSNNLSLQSESLFPSTQLQTQQNNQESSSESTIDSESSKDSESITGSSGDSSISTQESSSKPIIEEPPFDNIHINSQKNIKICESNANTTIVETHDNDIKDTNSNTMIPDPIPIIEEPKDDVINIDNNQTVIHELSLSSDNFTVKQINETEMLQTQPQISTVSIDIVQTMNVSKDDGVSLAVPSTPSPPPPTAAIITTTTTIPIATTLTPNLIVENDDITSTIVEQMDSKNIDAGESMEIDNEDTTMAAFQRIDDDNGDDNGVDDEPMEQESGELIKS